MCTINNEFPNVFLLQYFFDPGSSEGVVRALLQNMQQGTSAKSLLECVHDSNGRTVRDLVRIHCDSLLLQNVWNSKK